MVTIAIITDFCYICKQQENVSRFISFLMKGLEIGDAVFALDVRTQNTRLVTARQRQEIYALNRIMTRLENEKFKKFCQERGFKGDLVNFPPIKC